MADGAKCPNLQWCYHLYRKMFKKEYGEPTGLAMIDALRSLVAKYNEDCGSVCAKVETFGSEVVVVLCSPLMKRVHEYLKASGEMLFLDSGGMMDRQNSRVFTFLAPSVAGALPMGMIITSSESEDVLTFGMKELLTTLPSCAFYGRGTQGPVVGMTDDSTAERNSLKNVFLDIILLLCLFHILSALWRYVWDSKHKVDPKNKEEIFLLFKQWCLTKEEDDFKKRYNVLLADPRISGNKHLKKHIEDLCGRASEWALCYRNHLLVRGYNTDNYSEAAIRRFKEDVMNRVRAYSLTQLFDFFTTRLEAYFERRIADVLNNRKENYWKSKHFIKASKLERLKCFQSSRDNMFIVHNTEKKPTYIVDIELELCSCPVGFNGAPCKPQYAVIKDFNLSSTQYLPFEDVKAKAILHKIMTTTAPRPGWYAPLKSGPISHCNEVNDGDVDGNTWHTETCETASYSGGKFLEP
ncbi:Aggrecan core protein [Frankliniella fusca]|uniref:Aggrecan core protein n=1 Tax=Frankliniella fusca TaxID=407009 RepID=A0AAE1I4K0_9NEOP|nr:Aggrecan core protein [Frankliniella fusca]